MAGSVDDNVGLARALAAGGEDEDELVDKWVLGEEGFADSEAGGDVGASWSS